MWHQFKHLRTILQCDYSHNMKCYAYAYEFVEYSPVFMRYRFLPASVCSSILLLRILVSCRSWLIHLHIGFVLIINCGAFGTFTITHLFIQPNLLNYLFVSSLNGINFNAAFSARAYLINWKIFTRECKL